VFLPSSAPPPAPPSPPDANAALLDATLLKLGESGPLALLRDPATQKALAGLICSALGLPDNRRLLVFPFLRIVLNLIAGKVDAKAGALSVALRRKLLSMPHCARLLGWLQNYAAKAVRTADANKAIDAALAGTADAPLAAELRAALPRDLRASVATLERLDGIEQQLVASVKEIKQSVAPIGPELELGDPNTTARYVFYARETAFVGRTAERQALDRFLAFNDKHFAWTQIAGAGGQGKSRLALECCLAVGLQWRAGFLCSDSEPDWCRWQPTEPTLIVVDYVDRARAQRIGAAIRKLHGRAKDNKLDAPVRMLLLERDSVDNADWRASLLGFDCFDEPETRAAMAMPPLVLGDLGLVELLELVRARLAKSGVTEINDTEILADLQRIDNAGRPLFAMLYADARQAGAHTANWNNQEDLLRWVLRRERAHFWPADATDAERNTVLLATILGGLARSHLNTADDLLVHKPDLERRARLLRMAGVSLPAETDRDDYLRLLDTLPSRQPNILGEYFVLRTLCDADDPDLSAALFDRAFQVGRNATLVFWLRALMDFDGSALLDTDGLSASVKRGRVAVELAVISDLADMDRSLADTLAEHLQKRWNRHADSPEVKPLCAKAASSLITAFCDSGKIDRAKALLDDLESAAKTDPQNAEIRLIWAKAAFNLLNAFSNSGDIDKAEALLHDLARAANTDPPNDEILLEWANGAVNLINAFGNSGHIDKAEALLHDLAHAADTDPKNAEIRLRWAQGAFNLIVAFRNSGQIDKAEALLHDLLPVVAEHRTIPGWKELVEILKPVLP
jgi:hypothetical protein